VVLTYKNNGQQKGIENGQKSRYKEVKFVSQALNFAYFIIIYCSLSSCTKTLIYDGVLQPDKLKEGMPQKEEEALTNSPEIQLS